jgi:D-alanine transaminase
MDALANLNGEMIPLAEAKVSALDRGFLLGDAVYEVLRVYSGRPWMENEHFQRLAASLGAIRMPPIDLERLRERMRKTIATGPFREAIVYIQITRGAARRKHAFPKDATPLEFLYVDEFADPFLQARASGAAVITYPDLRWDRCDIKSTNLLGNVLAAQAAAEAGCIEAIFYSPDGTLTEGSHTSVFGVKDGVIVTAPNSSAILPGITRNLILRLAAQAGYLVRQERLKRSDLGVLSELFLTGTTSEVLPVVTVDGQKIGNGQPGPVTVRLQKGYIDAIGT